MEDLHEIAKRVHELQGAKRGTIRPDEFDLISRAVLQIIYELNSLDERLRTFEQRQQNSS